MMSSTIVVFVSQRHDIIVFRGSNYYFLVVYRSRVIVLYSIWSYQFIFYCSVNTIILNSNYHFGGNALDMAIKWESDSGRFWKLHVKMKLWYCFSNTLFVFVSSKFQWFLINLWRSFPKWQWICKIVSFEPCIPCYPSDLKKAYYRRRLFEFMLHNF